MIDMIQANRGKWGELHQKRQRDQELVNLPSTTRDGDIGDNDVPKAAS